MSAGSQRATHKSRKIDSNTWVVTPDSDEDSRETPSMVDIFSGPNAPVATAFRMCGWQAEALDKLISSDADLNGVARQQRLKSQM